MKISDIESFSHRAVSVDLHFPESAIVSQQHNKELISREVFPKPSKGYRLSRHQLTRVKGFDVSNLIFLTDDGRGRQTTEQSRWRSAKWEIKLIFCLKNFRTFEIQSMFVEWLDEESRICIFQRYYEFEFLETSSGHSQFEKAFVA